MKQPELLAPAGNLEKLKASILYGADAVYIGGEAYGLRAYADNFSMSEIIEGVDFAHQRKKKVYATMNIIPHNADLAGMEDYVVQLSEAKADAIIVSDPGVFSIIRHVNPDMEIHISTQANNTNWKSAAFWYGLGAKRVVLARELSFSEIREISEKTPEGLELEVFVHGSMCISYSGRCLLSNYMANRDSNRGACSHPCRWKYTLMEEQRPGEYFPVYENERGTFIFNSKDLCMIAHIPELIASGADSFKIEGRMKSSFYVASVVKSYRRAMDACFAAASIREGKTEKIWDPAWMEEMGKASHREYTTGFFLEKPDETAQMFSYNAYIREYNFLGTIMDMEVGSANEANMKPAQTENQMVVTVKQKNKFCVGDEVEIMLYDADYLICNVKYMEDDQGNSVESAPHAQMLVRITLGNIKIASAGTEENVPLKEDVAEDMTAFLHKVDLKGTLIRKRME